MRRIKKLENKFDKLLTIIIRVSRGEKLSFSDWEDLNIYLERK